MRHYNGLRDALLGGFEPATKPKVFVSYHHRNDQLYADRFGALFHEQYQVITDRSLKDEIDSNNAEYVYHRIRDEFIKGTSCTIVLCGQETMNRRYVDWEIKATLDKEHGLLAVVLPTCPRNYANTPIVPSRLAENINSGYARWIHWTEDVRSMIAAINNARAAATYTSLIHNSAPMMARSR